MVRESAWAAFTRRLSTKASSTARSSVSGPSTRASFCASAELLRAKESAATRTAAIERRTIDSVPGMATLLRHRSRLGRCRRRRRTPAAGRGLDHPGTREQTLVAASDDPVADGEAADDLDALRALEPGRHDARLGPAVAHDPDLRAFTEPRNGAARHRDRIGLLAGR